VHLTSAPADWYAARAGGVVAYVLLTAGVLLGMSMSSGVRLERWPRFALQDVHRFAGLLTGTFVTIHVVTIAIDAYLPFSLSSLLIPFTAAYRAVWTGLGVVAAELLLALAVTNRLRTIHRLDYARWRRVHYLNFAVWLAATAHGLGSGTDRSTTWLLALYTVAVAGVAGMTAWRVLRRRPLRSPRPALVPPATALAAAAIVLAAGLGPLQFHPKPWNAATFDDSLQGTLSRQAGNTRGLISLAGQGTGDQRVLVRADLLIAPQRLLQTAFQMEYLPSGRTCRGTVVRIDPDGLGFSARCRLAGDARTRSVQAHWSGGEGGRLAGGELHAL
jgi:sulfoxide reductase heme-binding subunit YedZ